MNRTNLNVLEVEYDETDPEGYRAGMARFGPSIGASKIGASLYVLPPGQSICPYHYEYPDEEWLIVLEGRPTLRNPEGQDELEPWDAVCFPPGPKGAHKVTNATALSVYPDSDKVGVWSGDGDVAHLFRRGDAVDYWDGEA